MPNILIVEDDININNLLCEVLIKAGYTCEQAFSGTEAKLLLNIKEKAYTLVLLDLMLPGASGEEVLKEIRKHGRLPVIVLSAQSISRCPWSLHYPEPSPEDLLTVPDRCDMEHIFHMSVHDILLRMPAAYLPDRLPVDLPQFAV